ncbi:proline racemase family protein [Paenibacillus agricola]|uniref:Proline racemase family protein n=1 Tax=Paenibacillus agricola TaxID=2716264 RepID=A0ABX0J9Q5_9BACL|nr:proline racemase family protein [Paenibacillus agricola]NHN32678.1 proline racemase family protein [Paenibacillus agricola]
MEFIKLYNAIDVHAGGQPIRIFTGGIPHLTGNTQMKKQSEFIRHHDHIRRLLLSEPRGHNAMTGCLLTPPVTEDGAFGVWFMSNNGYEALNAHGIIGVVTAQLETGQYPFTEMLIETSIGMINASAQYIDGKVKEVSFDNVPSYVVEEAVLISHHDREVKLDIAYGGAFFAIVDISSLGELTICEEHMPELLSCGRSIMNSLAAMRAINHPLYPDMAGVHGVVFTDWSQQEDGIIRNFTVYANGLFDRSPCGAGVCALMAFMFQRGELHVNQQKTYIGIIGSSLLGRVSAETTVASYPAIVPQISGNAHIMGFMSFVVDPADPLKEGFLLR